MKLKPIIKRLREKLPTGTWGSPVRVFGVAELERAIRGDHKPSFPSIYISYGGSSASVDTDRNAPLTMQTVVEVLDIYVLLDNKKNNDLTGLDAQEQVHDIRKTLLLMLMYWNLDIERDDDLGYVATELKFTSDAVHLVDSERYFHKFSFDHSFSASNCDQGIGTHNPETLDDLITVAGTIEPTHFTDDAPVLGFETTVQTP